MHLMKTGAPIYLLGSLQDTALQMYVVKEQNLDAHRFASYIQGMIISNVYPNSAKTESLTEMSNELIHNMGLYIHYNEATIMKEQREKDTHFMHMAKVVSDFTNKTAKLSDVFKVDAKNPKLNKNRK